MTRALRRAQTRRATRRIAAIRAIRSSDVGVPDTRPMARHTIGHGHPRARSWRSDEQRDDWGLRPIPSHREALNMEVIACVG